MRAAALRTRRTTRTQRHHGRLVPDPTFPAMAPRAQFAGATWAAKFTADQELVDLERVRTYDQQRVPFCTKRRPSLPAKEIGRAAAFLQRRHALVTSQEGQPAGPPLKIIITLNDAGHLQVVRQRVAQHPGGRSVKEGEGPRNAFRAILQQEHARGLGTHCQPPSFILGLVTIPSYRSVVEAGGRERRSLLPPATG